MFGRFILNCFITSLFIFKNVVHNQHFPENPCPEIFRYRQYRGNSFGEINIPYDGSKNLNLAVNISMIGLYENAKMKLELLTPSDEILSASNLLYRVNFPFRDIIPKITQITFNDRIYCYGPSEPVSINGVTNLWATLVFKLNTYTYNFQIGPVYASSTKRPNISNFDDDLYPLYNLSPNMQTNHKPVKTESKESCGIANDVQALVLKGESTAENEFPWLAAIFHKQDVSYNFQCTANLVTHRHVITAAHCIWFYKAPLINKEDILLVIGRSNISKWASTDALIRTALEMIPHPNYQQGSGHCDIAVIKMNEEVSFKPTVRPICLWNSDTNLKYIAGSVGVVAGWGKSEESHKIAAMPRKVSMPVVSQETCLRSHSDFKDLTSEMTFCAGNRNGSGPCNGDSGAGFVIKREGRWYLRGVVSTAIKNEDYSCDLNEFIVFSDVAKLKKWVQTVLNN